MISTAELISPKDLVADLEGERELCLLDVRDQGVYARGHLFFARCLSLSQLEAGIERLVPRKGTPIVLCDDGRQDATSLNRMASARAVLMSLGYETVRCLDGSAAEWERHGLKLFEGIYVPSKAFGEYIEHVDETPSISPEELHALRSDNPGIPVVDCRPLEEFRRMSLPGAANCPGGELIYRLPALLEAPELPVVINCAGRTRSIIGAQTLIASGIPNPVYALRNGTMGWELAGFSVEHGKSLEVGRPDAAAMQGAQALAGTWRSAEKIPVISWDKYLEMESADDRTTYLFDVRDPKEFAEARLTGARNAPAGQLVQCTDTYIGTLRSRIVLFDDAGVRNTMAAYWLRRSGWREVFVLDEGPMETTPQGICRFAHLVPPEARLAAETARARSEGATLLDLSPSGVFLQGHAPGALFTLREGLLERLLGAGIRGPLVIMARDPDIACLAYRDIASNWPDDVMVLFADHGEWPAAFGDFESGFVNSLSPPQDMWHTPSSPLGGGKPAMVEYLNWEVDLLYRAENEPGWALRPQQSVQLPR